MQEYRGGDTEQHDLTDHFSVHKLKSKQVVYIGCVSVTHRIPQAGQVANEGVFDSCNFDASETEPVSPGCAVHLVGRWPPPH